MPAACLRLWAVPIALSLHAVRAAEQQSAWADLTAPEQQENATAFVFVENKALVDVLITDCDENATVPAGGNLSLEVPAGNFLWFVPAGLAWDCDDGPFDLFHFATNSTGTEFRASVGYGLPGAEQPDEDNDTQAAASEGSGVAGVELSAGAGASTRCRPGLCEAG